MKTLVKDWTWSGLGFGDAITCMGTLKPCATSPDPYIVKCPKENFYQTDFMEYKDVLRLYIRESAYQIKFSDIETVYQFYGPIDVYVLIMRPNNICSVRHAIVLTSHNCNYNPYRNRTTENYWMAINGVNKQLVGVYDIEKVADENLPQFLTEQIMRYFQYWEDNFHESIKATKRHLKKINKNKTEEK